MTGPATEERRDRAASVGESVVSLAGGATLARVVGALSTVYLARALGPGGFGILGFALALARYVSLMIDGGLNAVGARAVARERSRAAALAAGVTVIRLILATVAAACLVLIVWLLPKPAAVKQVLLLTGLSFFALAVSTAWMHQGLERNRVVGASLVLSQLVSLAIVLMVVSGPDDVSRVPPAMFAGELGAAALLAVFAFRSAGFRPDLRAGWRIFLDSRPLIVTRVMRTSLFNLDVVLLGFLMSDHAVGLYSASYRVCFLLIALTAALLFSYLPSFTRAAREGPEAVSQLATHSLAFSVALGLPFAVGGVIVARPLLAALFGAEYAEAAPAFGLLVVGTALMLVQNTLRNVLLACERLRAEMWIMISATALNLGMNLLLIPRYGLVGAASATVAAEAVVLVLGFAFISRLQVWPRLRPLVGVFGAAGLMAAVLLAGGANLPIAASVPLGAAVYVAGLVLLRAVPRDAQPLADRFARLWRAGR